MKSNEVYINQVLDSIRKIEKFVSGLSKEKFLSDEKTQSAVIMQLALIGEVAKKISENTKKEIDLPWKNIVGFRDKAIHNYFEMDLDVVWNTITTDIVELKEKLKNYN